MSIVEEENDQLFSQLVELDNLLSQKVSELQELNNTIFEKNKLIEVFSAPSENVLRIKQFEIKKKLSISKKNLLYYNVL